MNIKLYTGNYKDCKTGNLISISGDRGRKAGFNGKILSCLAPKRGFWQIWHDNIGKIPDEENTRYYIEKYYEEVLLMVDFESLFDNEDDAILLCYENNEEFCHRHIVAAYLELKYGIVVPEIAIDENGKFTLKKKNETVKEILKKIMDGDGGKNENF